MKRRGFSLIEVIDVSALMVVTIGAIFQVFWDTGETADLMESKALAYNEARRAVQEMGRALRQADAASLSTLPANTLSFHIPALDTTPGEDIVITRDTEDANHDGLRENQLVLIRNGHAEVLANGLKKRSADENVDPGIWFERAGACVRVRICACQATGKGLALDAPVTLTILPRNGS